MSEQYYNPEQWLQSATRALKKYTEDGFHRSTRDENGNYVGMDPVLGVWDIRMVWPGTEVEAELVPLKRTIIHFEVDILENEILGFGHNIFRTSYNASEKWVQQQEARRHMLNFDVGIWSSDRSGGVTSRMRAYEILNNMFLGSLATYALKEFTSNDDGHLELISFSGGRFATERLNDVDTYRMIEGSLVIRVFDRTPLDLFPPAPSIEDIVQDPDLTIHE